MRSDDILDALDALDAEGLAAFVLNVNEHLLNTIDHLYDELCRLCEHRPEVFDESLVVAQQAQYAARKRLLELAE